jgi:N-acetyl sugar amidotransferase
MSFSTKYRFSAPSHVNKELFKPSNVGLLETRYGLSSNVHFCQSCVISNQRPNSAVEFSHNETSKKETIKIQNGICDACATAKVKNESIDWEKREFDLKVLCEKFRSRNGSYDCLVPGSGGKDSVFAAHVLKTKYGMNPLTVTWAPHLYTSWGWKNHRAWINAGFDNNLFTPNAKVHRLLTRLAVETIFHPFQPFIIGQKSFAPKMAIQNKIPLVFYGENEAEYGNPIEDNSKATRSYKYFSSEDKSKIFIGGVSVLELKESFGLTDGDLDAYLPANPLDLTSANVEVHYLGYYLKWHPQSCYYYAVENCGFEAAPERTPGTYSKYNSIDDKIDDFHYYTTFIKFGLGRASYDASQEIRSGDITREEGVALVKKFDGEYPARFEKEVFEYLSIYPKEFAVASKNFEEPIMSRSYFDLMTDRFRSPHLWGYTSEKGWFLRHNVWSKELPLMRDYQL